MACKNEAGLNTITMSWLNDLQTMNFEGGKSQFGESGIISFIFEHIEPTNKYFVDIGAGYYGKGQMSNTQELIDKGWAGIQVDADNSDNPNITALYVTPDNIIPAMRSWRVPRYFDFLNIDIDSFDLDILEVVIQGCAGYKGYSPTVICTEFNATLDPEKSIKLKYEEGYVWDETNKYGYSFGAAVKFCGKYGYKIILNHVNQNLFLVRGDLIEQTPVIEVKQTFYHPINHAAEWETY